MTTVLDIVDAPGGTALFGCQDLDGAKNPYGVGFAIRESTIDMGAFDPVYVSLASVNDGGSIVRARNPLMQMAFTLKVADDDLGDIVDALAYLGQLLAEGGRYLAWSPDGFVATRYIPFEPSPAVQVFVGQQLVLLHAERATVVLPDIPVRINRQPWAQGAELLGADNPLTNPTLLNDFGGTANRPDGWTLDSATGITAEDIDTGIDWGWAFTIADAGVHNLQQSTGAGTAAPGDVWTGSFEAKVDAVAGTPQAAAVVRFLNSSGTPIGSDATSGLFVLTTSWQRIDVTSAAAPATTDRVRLSLQQDNVDATSVRVRYRKAQVVEAPSFPGFRSGREAVAFNPASTALPRRLPIFVEGSMPTVGRLTVTADAATLGEVSVYRETGDPVTALQQSTHRQLESGTLGTGTSSVSDSNASGGNTAEVNYPATTPTFVSDTSGDVNESETVVVDRPAGITEGDLLLCAIAMVGGGDSFTPVTIPTGWSLLLNADNTLLNSNILIFQKTAVAAEPTTWTFVLEGGAFDTNMHGRWYVMCVTTVDPVRPIEAVNFTQAGSGSSTSVTAASVTTTRDNSLIVFMGKAVSNGADPHPFTPPTGATPTFTEREDAVHVHSSSNVAFTVDTGNLATAGATGTKTATATNAGSGNVGVLIAINGPASEFEERVRRTWTDIMPGDYDVWLRFYPTDESIMRIEAEWAPVDTPSEWTSMGRFVVDTTGAAAFAYVYRNLGRIHIPPEWPLDTLTIRVNSGLDEVSTARLRLDIIDLVPVNETVSTFTARGTVASGEKLSGDPASAMTFHLDASSTLMDIAYAAGAIPLPLEPGLNLLTIVTRQVAADLFDDRAGVLTAAPTVVVDVTPRFG